MSTSNYNTKRLSVNQALTSLSAIIDVLQADFENYISKENYSEQFAHLLGCRVRDLKFIYDTIFDFIEESNLQYLDAVKKIAIQKELRTKLEGCCLIHGIPAWHIQLWLLKPIQQVYNEVKFAAERQTITINGKTIVTKEPFYQLPFHFSTPEQKKNFLKKILWLNLLLNIQKQVGTTISHSMNIRAIRILLSDACSALPIHRKK